MVISKPFVPSSPRRDTVVSSAQPVAVAARVRLALALLVDHLGLGLGEKGRITELRCELREVGIEPADLLGKPRLLACKVDDVAKSKNKGSALNHHLNPTAHDP